MATTDDTQGKLARVYDQATDTWFPLLGLAQPHTHTADGLSDVAITSVANNDIIAYSSSASAFVNTASANLTSAVVTNSNITNGTIANLIATSASVSTASLIQPDTTSKPLVIKSAAPSTGTITGATVSSGSVIYSIASASATFSVSDLVTITGITPDTLNDTRAVVGAVSASSITIFSGKQGTYSSGGTATRIHANLLEVQNSSGTSIAAIRSDGSATGGFNSGLTLLNTTTFSGVASQSFNNVFSATYNNYFMTLSNTGSTTTQSLRMRVRASGTDNSATNYFGKQFGGNSDQAGITTNDVAGTFLEIGIAKTGEVSSSDVSFRNPFSSSLRTHIFSNTVFSDGTNGRVYNYGAALSVTTSYDGFTIFPASGTITGTVSIYGYNK